MYPLHGLIDRVNEAISKQQSIFIAYDNNNQTMKTNARKISPLHWEVHGQRFNAKVHYVGAPNDPESKSFLICKILRIENKSWDPTPDLTTSTLTSPLPSLLTLEGWLERLGMSSYLPTLQQHGFGTLAMLSALDEETLNVLGITLLAHRMQFLKKAKETS